MAASICVASSRVGARIRARGRPGLTRRPDCDRRVSSGSGRRRSCRSRCGHRRGRHDRRGSPAAWRPGSGVGVVIPRGLEDRDEGGGHAEGGKGRVGGHRWALQKNWMRSFCPARARSSVDVVAAQERIDGAGASVSRMPGQEEATRGRTGRAAGVNGSGPGPHSSNRPCRVRPDPATKGLVTPRPEAPWVRPCS